MNELSNAFSLLELDVEDATEHINVASDDGDGNCENRGTNPFYFLFFPFQALLIISFICMVESFNWLSFSEVFGLIDDINLMFYNVELAIRTQVSCIP